MRRRRVAHRLRRARWRLAQHDALGTARHHRDRLVERDAGRTRVVDRSLWAAGDRDALVVVLRHGPLLTGRMVLAGRRRIVRPARRRAAGGLRRRRRVPMDVVVGWRRGCRLGRRRIRGRQVRRRWRIRWRRIRRRRCRRGRLRAAARGERDDERRGEAAARHARGHPRSIALLRTLQSTSSRRICRGARSHRATWGTARCAESASRGCSDHRAPSRSADT